MGKSGREFRENDQRGRRDESRNKKRDWLMTETARAPKLPTGRGEQLDRPYRKAA